MKKCNDIICILMEKMYNNNIIVITGYSNIYHFLPSYLSVIHFVILRSSMSQQPNILKSRLQDEFVASFSPPHRHPRALQQNINVALVGMENVFHIVWSEFSEEFYYCRYFAYVINIIGSNICTRNEETRD